MKRPSVPVLLLLCFLAGPFLSACRNPATDVDPSSTSTATTSGKAFITCRAQAGNVYLEDIARAGSVRSVRSGYYSYVSIKSGSEMRIPVNDCVIEAPR